MPARVRMGVTTTGGRTTCAARNALDAAGRDAARVRARPRISPTPPIKDLSFLFFPQEIIMMRKLIASTSGRIHCELLRLLFLHAHRETMRFFEIFEDVHAQPHTSRFTYRRAAFFNTLKSKIGLMVARAAALRTNINIDGRPLATKKRRRTSSKA